MKIRYTVFLIVLICLSLGMVMAKDSLGASAEELFYQAEADYRKFRNQPEKMGFRHNWQPHIRKFIQAYQKNPKSSLAPASLFMAGKLYQELYQRSRLSSDKQAALDKFHQVIRKYPGSLYRKKATSEIYALTGKKPSGGKKSTKTAKNPSSPTNIKRDNRVPLKLRDEEFVRAKAQYHASKKTTKSTHIPGAVPDPPRFRLSNAAVVTGLRVWSNPNYTRIVIDVNGETAYTHQLLEQDPRTNKPKRLYIDFENTILGRTIQKIIPINDDLLINARAAQHKPDSVRVVIDVKSFKNYKIFSLRNPFRTIIDVWGKEASETFPPPVKPPVVRHEPKVSPRSTSPIKRSKTGDLAKQLALGVRRIVVDPGHGGKDVGAVGYYKHVYEKNVVLGIGKRLARKIRSQLGCEVIMTRSTDRFLTLEERTAIANTKNADLFISIHTNAHKNRNARGIETYYLNFTTDEDAILVAQRENAATRKNLSDLESILSDLLQNAKINESSRLAGYVQQSLVKQVKKQYRRTKNKGVKQALFYVLMGAQMPSILVETSFISNKTECRRLTQAEYQDRIAQGIVDGIRLYIQRTSPTALIRKPVAMDSNG